MYRLSEFTFSASKSLLINNLYLGVACFPAIRGKVGEFAATTCSREFSSIDIWPNSLVEFSEPEKPSTGLGADLYRRVRNLTPCQATSQRTIDSLSLVKSKERSALAAPALLRPNFPLARLRLFRIADCPETNPATCPSSPMISAARATPESGCVPRGWDKLRCAAR